MSQDKTHPEGCMCDPCKTFRHEARFREDYPGAHRRLRFSRGRNPTELEKKVPRGMSMQRAIEEGYI